jgi:hypothetical protein
LPTASVKRCIKKGGITFFAYRECEKVRFDGYKYIFFIAARIMGCILCCE